MDNKKENIKDRLNFLARKWQEGTIVLEEKREFEEWYHSFDDSLIELEEDEDITLIKERIFNAVEKEVGASKSKKSFFKRSFFRFAAAILVFSIPIGWYLHYVLLKERPMELTSLQDIEPGEQKAVLILSDGSRVELDGNSKEQVMTVEGAEIERKEGQLVYAATKGEKHAVPLHHTIQIPKGGIYELSLPDGTKVWLNAASSLRYPVEFTEKSREVELTGEAYFEVAKDKKRPFIVKSNKLTVEVLGTHFNMNAYEDEREIKTSLFEGKVKLIQANNSVVLQPMQEATVNLSSDKLQVDPIDSQDAISWKNGDFVFNDELITSVMKKISRWYDVEVVYSGNVPHTRYVGKISRSENVSEVLKMLSLTKTIHFQVEGRRVTVMD